MAKDKTAVIVFRVSVKLKDGSIHYFHFGKEAMADGFLSEAAQVDGVTVAQYEQFIYVYNGTERPLNTLLNYVSRHKVAA